MKPGFFSNEALAELPMAGRLLFAGLWTIADRKGRLDDRPKRIKAQVFPYDDGVEVAALLDQLEEKGFIRRYVVDGADFIQIVNFEKHQSPHVKEAPSTIPAPDEPDASAGNYEASPAVAETVTVPVAETETGAVEDAPEHPFALTYAVEYGRRHPGQHVSQTEHAAALSLERKYGSEACLELGRDLDWTKHANYMRPILEERANDTGPRLQTAGRSARGSPRSAGPGTDDWERYAAGES